MARGEMVMLNRRVYTNADKSAVVEQGTPEAAWFIGGPGTQIAKDVADAYGLTADDYEVVPNAMSAILAQEKSNREAHAVSAATVVEPNAAFEQVARERRTFNRETGEPIVGATPASTANIAEPNPMPEEVKEEQADTASAEESSDTAETKAVTSPPQTRERTPEETRSRGGATNASRR